MVELQKKYQIGARRFGIINWVGAYSLFKKEVLRFCAKGAEKDIHQFSCNDGSVILATQNLPTTTTTAMTATTTATMTTTTMPRRRHPFPNFSKK